MTVNIYPAIFANKPMLDKVFTFQAPKDPTTGDIIISAELQQVINQLRAENFREETPVNIPNSQLCFVMCAIHGTSHIPSYIVGPNPNMHIIRLGHHHPDTNSITYSLVLTHSIPQVGDRFYKDKDGQNTYVYDVYIPTHSNNQVDVYISENPCFKGVNITNNKPVPVGINTQGHAVPVVVTNH